MKVFLSWSDDQSRALAGVLKDWLGEVIQAVEPWISTSIDKGSRGLEEIADALETSRVGIICLTRQNLTEPWILFEAGALSKTRDRVWTFLLDLTPADVEPPLGMFQHTQSNKEDVRALLGSINREVEKSGERSLTEKQLDSVFATYWPKLEETLARIRASAHTATAPVRSDRELLEEILQLTRTQHEIATAPPVHSATSDAARVVLRREMDSINAHRTYLHLKGPTELVRRGARELRGAGFGVRILDVVANGIIVRADVSTVGEVTKVLELLAPLGDISVDVLSPADVRRRMQGRLRKTPPTEE
jgi:hypothetical protein